jgi:GT2 family glycosyltransferase
MKELSVIIVSFNVCHYLRQALHSVEEAASAIDYELVVVDNASADDSALMVREEFKNVILIVSDSNEGFSSACNKGIIASSGEFILILNPDTVIDREAITVALTFMKSHPEAGAAGAKMVDGNGKFLPESKRGFPSPLTSLFRFTGMGRIFPHSSLFNAYYLGHLPDNETCRADILTGAFMFIRREALNKTGLFDTSFFMYGEDIDLSWRLIRAGYTNYYLPAAIITHFKGRSAVTEEKSSLNHFYNAMIIFTGKHLGHRWHLPVTVCVKVMLAFAQSSLFLRKLIKS